MMTFDEWIIENQNLIWEQERDIHWNILLEKKIEEEQKKRQPRRSERIAKKKEESQINKAYEAYVKSIEAQIKGSH